MGLPMGICILQPSAQCEDESSENANSYKITNLIHLSQRRVVLLWSSTRRVPTPCEGGGSICVNVAGSSTGISLLTATPLRLSALFNGTSLSDAAAAWPESSVSQISSMAPVSSAGTYDWPASLPGSPFTIVNTTVTLASVQDSALLPTISGSAFLGVSASGMASALATQLRSRNDVTAFLAAGSGLSTALWYTAAFDSLADILGLAADTAPSSDVWNEVNALTHSQCSCDAAGGLAYSYSASLTGSTNATSDGFGYGACKPLPSPILPGSVALGSTLPPDAPQRSPFVQNMGASAWCGPATMSSSK